MSQSKPDSRPVQDLEIALDCMRHVIQYATEPANVLGEMPWCSLDDIIREMKEHHYDHYLLYKPNQLDIDVRQTVENSMLALIIAGVTLGGFKYDLDAKRAMDPYVHRWNERFHPIADMIGQITPLTASLYYLLDTSHDHPTGYRNRPLNELAKQVKSPEGLVHTYLLGIKQNYMTNYPGKFPVPWINVTPVTMHDQNGEPNHKRLFAELRWATDLNSLEE